MPDRRARAGAGARVGARSRARVGVPPGGRLATTSRRLLGRILQGRRRWQARADRRELTGVEVLPLSAAESIEDLANRLDIASRQQIIGQTYRYDIRRADVAKLLVSASAAARSRHQHLWVHAGGQLAQLDRATRGELARVLRAGRARLLVADTRNRLVENICIDLWRELPDKSWQAIAPDAPLARFQVQPPSAEPAEQRRVDSVPDFPIDAIYTWVNAADPGWRAQYSQHRDLAHVDAERYVPLDELRFSLRSLDMFAPWIRRIHVFSNCAPPDWFVPSDRVRWVDHSAAIPAAYLPLFNSDAIETFLHRLPDISEHFLYFNDDFLLADSVFPSTFFSGYGRSAAFFSKTGSTLFLERLVSANAAKEFLAGRVNGARLLHGRFGTYPTLLLRHAPYAFTVAGWRALEEAFPAELEATRLARFRSHEAVAWAAFVYAHFGMLTGSGIKGTARQYKISPPKIQRLLRRLERQRSPMREFANVAPSGQAALDPVFRSAMSRYFRRQWPFASKAERSTT